MRGNLTNLALAVTLVIALALPAAAGAQSGSCTPPTSVYSPVPCAPPDVERHPFTGFEAGLVALVGLGLFGTGFAMRRLTRLQD